MEPLHRRLGLSAPFLSENGAGVYFPLGAGRPPAGAVRSGPWWRLALGRPYPRVVRGLRRLRRRLGWRMLGFSDLTPEGVAALTGLGPAAARRAAQREFDEPLILLDPEGADQADLARLEREAADEGLVLVRGGRFLHLHAGPGKGAALELALAWLRQRRPVGMSLGLGDAPNDFDLLSRVDVPVLVASGRAYPGLVHDLPGLRQTSARGAAGFNEAVLAILRPS
jgi:mannosyl-3-phosphoglycerate phosphatase